jgi:dynein heavy chain 2
MNEMNKHWEELENKIEKLYSDAKQFNMQPPRFQYYDMMKEELNTAQSTWGLFNEFKNEMEKFNQEEWLTFKKKGYFAFQDFFIKYQEALKQKEKNVVVRFLLNQIEQYKLSWPLLKLCTGESFEKEHWKRLFTILKLSKDTTLDNLKFGELVLSIPTMIKKSKEIKELSDKAQGEVTIREAINELRVWCENTEFILTEHESNGRQTPLIKEWKEVITQVSDHQSLILSLKESRFYQGFADQIQQIEQKLGGIDDYLAKLNVIQRKWVYLEPIFMRGALPQEQGRFMRVDEDFRGIALGIGRDPKVVSLCDVPGIKETLETILS